MCTQCVNRIARGREIQNANDGRVEKMFTAPWKRGCPWPPSRRQPWRPCPRACCSWTPPWPLRCTGRSQHCVNAPSPTTHRSWASLSAASLAAARSVGLAAIFLLMSSTDRPTKARCVRTARRRRVLEPSSFLSFLCRRRHASVHVSLAGLMFCLLQGYNGVSRRRPGQYSGARRAKVWNALHELGLAGDKVQRLAVLADEAEAMTRLRSGV